MRLRPEQRLRRQNDIRAVRERGFRSDWRFFTLWALAVSQERRSRFAVIASIAAIGNSVERSRSKRRLREVFRRHQDKVPAGHDLLLISRTALKTAPFAELEHRFLAACEHLRKSIAAPPA